MSLHRLNVLGMALGLVALGATGCATKNYVRTQTGPLVDHTQQLDQKTADNNRQLHDVDDRATAGITKAQGAALHKNDRQIRQEERSMASQNGSHITKSEQRTLNQQENANSRKIGQ